MIKLNLQTRPKFKKEVITLRKFLNERIGDIDCQPVGQRLDTTPGPEKREGIIGAIIDGINIGEITICESPDNPQGFDNESIDGGHRKRYSFDYVKSKGLKIMVWTINDVATFDHLIELNVDGIITDKPKLLFETLQKA